MVAAGSKTPSSSWTAAASRLAPEPAAAACARAAASQRPYVNGSMADRTSSKSRPPQISSKAARPCGYQLALAQRHRAAPVVLGDGEADGPGAGRDQDERADPVRVGGRVERGEVAGGRVPEEVDLRQAEVLAQRLHVVDQPVAAVRGHVVRHRRVTRAPLVEQDQLAVDVEAAQVAQVGGGPRGPAGQTDQRLPRPHQMVGELGPVVRGELRHDRDPHSPWWSGQGVFAESANGSAIGSTADAVKHVVHRP